VMADDDVPRILISETGLSSPFLTRQSSTAEAEAVESNFDVSPAERPAVMPQFQARVLRVIDGQLFVVDPGSPPASLA